MRTFFVASFISPDVPGEFSSQEWPLHLTILGKFETELPEDDLVRLTRAACEGTQGPIVVSGMGRENFGAEYNIPVTEVNYPNPLAWLRSDLMQEYDDAATYVGRQYATYRPHVTDQRDERLEVGATLTLPSVSLIEELPADRWRVIETFALGD